jgi:hypothetical protein
LTALRAAIRQQAKNGGVAKIQEYRIFRKLLIETLAARGKS